jgi:hypothetical protein
MSDDARLTGEPSVPRLRHRIAARYHAPDDPGAKAPLPAVQA